METPTVDHSINDHDSIENTSPPSDFEHGGMFTPKPPRVKFTRTPFLSRILNRGSSESKKDFSSPDAMDVSEGSKVSFRMEVDAIPVDNVFYSEAEEYDHDVDSNHSTDDELETSFGIQPSGDKDIGNSEDMTDYLADISAEEEPVSVSTSASSSITKLIKSFVLVEVGPNLSDTVHEYSNLLSDISKKKNGTVATSLHNE